MPNPLNRRNLLLGAGSAAVAGMGAWAMRPGFEGTGMTPPEAHEAAVAGKVLLVDIRRPEEWRKTGVGEGAHPLDMRREDFVEALLALTGGDRSRPVALICASGARSDRTSLKLEKAGFTRIIDVPEGMTGSRAGPGWVARNLPVVAYRGG